MGRAAEIAGPVEDFAREAIISYEMDPRRDTHSPIDAPVAEVRAKARAARVRLPHILPTAAPGARGRCRRSIRSILLADVRAFWNLRPV